MTKGQNVPVDPEEASGVLAIRLTPEQRRRLALWADEAGLGVSKYVRQRLGLEATVQPAPHLPPSDFTPKEVALVKTRLEPIFIDTPQEVARPDHTGLVIPDEVISAPDYLALTNKAPDITPSIDYLTDPLIVHTKEPEKLTAADVPKHRHKRANKIATEFDKGTKVEVWACACGKEMR